MSIRFFASIVTLIGPLMIPHAIAAAPAHDAFGSLNVNTFSTKRTPKSTASLASKLSHGSPLTTVAMSTAQQHSSPPLTNAGADSYLAQAGRPLGDAGQRSTRDALWNFSDHMNTNNNIAAAFADHHTEPPYAIDPALNDGAASAASITATNATLALPSGMFDATAAAETHSNRQSAQSSWSLKNIAADMQVIDLTGAAWLLGSAMLGLFAVARRNKA